MKDIKQFILEATSKAAEKSIEIEKALEDYAEGVLDYLNQEGVVAWDERKMIKYVNGDEEPDFQDLIDCMINQLEEFGDKGKVKLLPILKKYNTKEWKESIEVACLRAMDHYTKDIR